MSRVFLSEMENKMDLRIKRTKQSIIDAFLELLRDKDFNDISICDIAKKALIARPTFYLHFKEKREVLIEYLDRIFAEYLEEIKPVLEKGDQLGLSTALFRQVQKNAPYLSSLIKDNSVDIIQDKMHQYIQEVFGLLLMEKIGNQSMNLPDNLRPYVIAAIAGMVYSVILQWMETGMQESPEQVGQLLQDISRPGIIDLLKRDTN